MATQFRVFTSLENNIFDQLNFLFFETLIITGKSFSEAPILASTNPQYDKRLFMELP